MSKTVAIGEFQTHSLELFEEVAEKEEEIVVVDHGKPLVKVVPVTWQRNDYAGSAPRRHRTLEELRGSVTILGDIVEPFDDAWDCMK
jgi:prevent-host-death family protein